MKKIIVILLLSVMFAPKNNGQEGVKPKEKSGTVRKMPTFTEMGETLSAEYAKKQQYQEQKQEGTKKILKAYEPEQGQPTTLENITERRLTTPSLETTPKQAEQQFIPLPEKPSPGEEEHYQSIPATVLLNLLNDISTTMRFNRLTISEINILKHENESKLKKYTPGAPKYEEINVNIEKLETLQNELKVLGVKDLTVSGVTEALQEKEKTKKTAANLPEIEQQMAILTDLRSRLLNPKTILEYQTLYDEFQLLKAKSPLVKNIKDLTSEKLTELINNEKAEKSAKEPLKILQEIARELEDYEKKFKILKVEARPTAISEPQQANMIMQYNETIGKFEEQIKAIINKETDVTKLSDKVILTRLLEKLEQQIPTATPKELIDLQNQINGVKQLIEIATTISIIKQSRPIILKIDQWKLTRPFDVVFPQTIEKSDQKRVMKSLNDKLGKGLGNINNATLFDRIANRYEFRAGEKDAKKLKETNDEIAQLEGLFLNLDSKTFNEQLQNKLIDAKNQLALFYLSNIEKFGSKTISITEALTTTDLQKKIVQLEEQLKDNQESANVLHLKNGIRDLKIILTLKVAAETKAAIEGAKK